MIFTYILPGLLMSPILYLAIFKIKHKLFSLLLGNVLWILPIIIIFIIYHKTEYLPFFIALILPITTLSLVFTMIRISINFKLNQN